MLRKSRQRDAILRVVKGTNSHPTANWIYDQVRGEIPNISLGTVYRNLRLLVDEGQILAIELAGTLSRFDGNTQYHHHFICERCGRVFDVTNDERMEKAMVDEITRGADFKVTHHRYELYGLCKDCQS